MHRHGGAAPRLLLMLDEFPALGRLDFFETALAFMAGYGIRAFLIAQSPQPDRQGLWREQFHPRQLPCAGRLRDQRRAHREAHLGCARHRDRAARDAQLCRPPARALARPCHGQPPGDRAAAADARRSHAAARRATSWSWCRARRRSARSKLRYLRGPQLHGRGCCPAPALGDGVYADRPPQRARRLGRLARRPVRDCRGARKARRSQARAASAGAPSRAFERSGEPSPARTRRSARPWRGRGRARRKRAVARAHARARAGRSRPTASTRARVAAATCCRASEATMARADLVRHQLFLSAGLERAPRRRSPRARRVQVADPCRRARRLARAQGRRRARDCAS